MIITRKGGHRVTLRPGESLRIDLNAPIVQPYALDSELLAVAGYGRARERVIAHLNAADPETSWVDDRDRRAHVSGLQFDVDDYAGRTLLPTWFVGRVLPGALVMDQTAPARLRVLADDLQIAGLDGDGTTVRVGKAQIDIESAMLKVFDFGISTLNVRLRLSGEKALGPDEIRDAAETMSRLVVTLFAPAVLQSYRALRDAVLRLSEASQVPDVPRGVLVSDDQAHQDTLRVLWVHRIYRVEATEALDSEACVDALDDLLPAMPATDLVPICCPGSTLLPGVGSSAVAHTAAGDPGVLTSIVDLKNAFYAGAMELDRELFREITEFSVRTRDCTLSELEAHSRALEVLAERVRVFRLLEAGVSLHLSPLAQALWHRIDAAWDMGRLLANVDAKLASLQNLFERSFRDASSRRQTRLNVSVGVFTIISLVSTIVTVATFVFVNEPTDLQYRVRFQAVVIAAVTTLFLGLALVSILRTTRVRRPASTAPVEQLDD